MSGPPATLVVVVGGYLLGSIPFGLLLTRAAGLGDIRKIGSGNIGATNVLRSGHRGLAALTLLLDGAKGSAAVLLGDLTTGGFAAPCCVTTPAVVLGLVGGLAAFLGHIFPVWLKFNGGKGVATYIGVLLAAYWPGGLLFIAMWLATAYLSRYSSLSALLASVIVPLAMLAMQVRGAALLLAMSALLIFKHRSNIERLLSGTEPKLGVRK